LLYYQSPRGGGLEPIVVGIVREVAKSNFGIIISMEQLSTQNKEANIAYSCWRIIVTEELDTVLKIKSPLCVDISNIASVTIPSSMECPFQKSLMAGNKLSSLNKLQGPVNKAKQSLQKLRVNTKESAIESPNNLAISPGSSKLQQKVYRSTSSFSHCYDSSLKTESVLTDTKEETENCINEKNSKIHLPPLTPKTSFGLTADMISDLYPYHIVFDQSLSILQCGKYLESVINKSLIGKNMLDCFNVTDPCSLGSGNSEWEFFIKRSEHSHMVMTSRSSRNSNFNSLSLLGPVVFKENNSVAIVLCVPNVTSLADMRKQGLTISDIPKNDFHRQMLLLSEHLSSETEYGYRLSKITSELELERGKSLRAITEAAEFAKSALTTKKTFVRYVSHEIRTPLTVSKVGLDLISDKIKELGGTEETNEILADCQQSMNVALSILDDLLSYEKLEGGIMDIYKSYVPAVSFIVKTLSPFKLQAKMKDIELHWNINIDTSSLVFNDFSSPNVSPEQLFILIDETKMSQVYRNLLSNAIKFSQNGSKVTVDLSVNSCIDDLNKSPRKTTDESLTRGRNIVTESSVQCERYFEL
jgi:signal transduction histidine kinase